METVVEGEALSSEEMLGGPLTYVFVDESGTNALDVSTSGSHYFICAAVLVRECDLDNLTDRVDEVAATLCGGAEIKSSRIGGDRRRIRFLEAVQDAPFTFRALIVQKALVSANSGLRYKTSFHKFAKRILQQPLGKYTSGSVKVVFDEFGTPQFIKSFTEYMNNSVVPNLFSSYENVSMSSSDSRPLQLADLIAGSLAHCFEPGMRGILSADIRQLLRTKQLDITAWPLLNPPTTTTDSTSATAEAQMHDGALEHTRQLLRTYQRSTAPVDRLKAAALEHLLFCRLMEEGGGQYVYGDSLVDLLQEQGYELPSTQFLRSTIIGEFRDKGVMIAGTQHGYKLALNLNDIDEYLSHTRGVVSPMLARVGTARARAKALTGGGVDILESWPELLAMVEAAEDSALPDYISLPAGEDSAALNVTDS